MSRIEELARKVSQAAKVNERINKCIPLIESLLEAIVKNQIPINIELREPEAVADTERPKHAPSSSGTSVITKCPNCGCQLTLSSP